MYDVQYYIMCTSMYVYVHILNNEIQSKKFEVEKTYNNIEKVT